MEHHPSIDDRLKVVIFHTFHSYVSLPLQQIIRKSSTAIKAPYTYPLVMTKNLLVKMAIEIVSFPTKSMVDLSSSLSKRLPEGISIKPLINPIKSPLNHPARGGKPCMYLYIYIYR